MSNDLNQVRAAQIGLLIYIVRGQRVMLDSDLATLYGVSTKHLGGHDQAIKTLFGAIKQLLEPPLKEEKGREMGFHMKEEARRYRVRNGA